MEEERLWKFSRPEWLNTVWARNAGVYSAGAIVCYVLWIVADLAIHCYALHACCQCVMRGLCAKDNVQSQLTGLP